MLLSMHPARLPQYPYPTSALQSAASLHQRSSTYPSSYCCDMTAGTSAGSTSHYYPSANIAGILNQQTANLIYQQQQSFTSTPDPASNDSPSPISTGYNSQSVVGSEYCSPESPHNETLPAEGSTFEQIYSESCCYSNCDATAPAPSSDDLNEDFETTSSIAGMEQHTNVDSPNESLSSPIVVEGSPQSPCILNNGEEFSPSDQSHLKLSPSDPSLITQQPPNYDSPPPDSSCTPDTSSTCSTPMDQHYNRQQQQYYCSVGYGGSSNSTQLLYDSSYSSNSYDLSQYSSYSGSSYGSNGIGSYCNTGGGSTLPAYYTNYYTSQQYNGTSQLQSTAAGCSTSTSSATAGYSSDYIGGGYPYSSGTIGTTITTGQQQGHTNSAAYASLWNSYPAIGTPSGLSLTGSHQQYSKVSYDTPRFKLTPERAIPLIKWFEEHKDHPYPSRHEKMVLCQSTQLTFTQVSTWFANARRRMKKAAHEDDELEDCIGGVSDDEKLK